MKNFYFLTITLFAFVFSTAQSTNSCTAGYDDFSNPALWSHPILGATLQSASNFNTLSIYGGNFSFDQSRDNNMNFLYRSGFTISDSNFKVEIDFRHTSNGITAGGAGHVILALNDDAQPFFNSTTSVGGTPMSATPLIVTPSIHHGIAVTFESDTNVAPTDFSFKVYVNDGGTITTVGTPISVGGPLVGGASSNYFLQLVRVGSSSGLLNVYSDSARTMLINTSGLFSIPATVVNLNTVQFGTNEWQNANRMLTGKLDNLCIDNTVITTSPNMCNSVFDDFSTPFVWSHPISSSALACNTLATMTINSGQFKFLQSRDNNINYLNRSGIVISNTDFKADIDFTHTSNGSSLPPNGIGGAGHTLLALNAGFKPFFSDPSSSAGLPGAPCSASPLSLVVSAQKGIAVTFESDLPEDPTNFFFKVYINDGSGAFPTVVSTSISVGPAGVGGLNTNYYLRLERSGTTMGTLSVFSNLARTILVGTPIFFTIPSTITGLNTVQIGGNEWQDERRMLTGVLDNLCIHNTTPLSTTSLEKESNRIKIFPNPTNNILNVLANETINKMELFDINGRMIYTATPDKNVVSLDVEEFTSGMYLLKVTTQNGIETKKIIKN